MEPGWRTRLAILALCCVLVSGSHTPKRPQYVGNQALSTARRTRAGQLGPTFEEQVALVVDKDTARGRKGTVRKNEAHRIQAEKHLSKKLHLDSFSGAIQRSMSMGKPINTPLKGWSEANAPRDVEERPDARLYIKTNSAVPSARAVAASFVVITEQQSGVNLLAAHLNLNPKIDCGGEVFPRDACAEAEDFACFRRALVAAWETQPKQAGGVPAPARGFVWILDERLQRWRGELLEQLNARGGRVLFLWRRNTLRRLLSRRAQGNEADEEAVTLNATTLVEKFDKELARQHEVEAFFTAGLPQGSVLVRHFEDLQGDAVPDLIQRDVAKLLAVPPLVTGHTHTAQQAVPPSLIQRIANYDEVVAALRDTAYEDFISRR